MAGKLLTNLDADKAEEAQAKQVQDRGESWVQRCLKCIPCVSRAQQLAEERAVAPVMLEATRLFQLIDLDGNGTLSVDELTQVRHKATFGDPADIFKKMDTNKDGVVAMDEWLSYIRDEWRKSPIVVSKLMVVCEGVITEKRSRDAHSAITTKWPLREEAERVFGLLDADGSRLLDVNELKALKKTSAELQRIHTDKSGQLDLAEFLLYVKNWFDKDPECAKQLLALFELGAKNDGIRRSQKQLLYGKNWYT